MTVDFCYPCTFSVAVYRASYFQSRLSSSDPHGSKSAVDNAQTDNQDRNRKWAILLGLGAAALGITVYVVSNLIRLLKLFCCVLSVIQVNKSGVMYLRYSVDINEVIMGKAN